MAAQEARQALRRNKSLLLEILSGESGSTVIFTKVDQLEIITKREYRKLNTNRDDVEEKMVRLLDIIYDKGEGACKRFLDILKTDKDIIATFPRLEEIQWREEPSSRKRPLTDHNPTCQGRLH